MVQTIRLKIKMVTNKTNLKKMRPKTNMKNDTHDEADDSAFNKNVPKKTSMNVMENEEVDEDNTLMGMMEVRMGTMTNTMMERMMVILCIYHGMPWCGNPFRGTGR